MFFLIRKEIDLARVVLEEMSDDAVADASGTASYYVNLVLPEYPTVRCSRGISPFR